MPGRGPTTPQVGWVGPPHWATSSLGAHSDGPPTAVVLLKSFAFELIIQIFKKEFLEQVQKILKKVPKIKKLTKAVFLHFDLILLN